MTDKERADLQLWLVNDAWREPLAFWNLLWRPAYPAGLYKEQCDIMLSVKDNYETDVLASNKMGKDFVAASIALWFFLTRNPVKVVTTSATEKHLMVLWGEMKAFIDKSVLPLKSEHGGPLLIGHNLMRKVDQTGGESDTVSNVYMVGLVAGPGTEAALGGHHVAQTGDGIPRTLLIADEASSVSDAHIEKAEPWANRFLRIGNAWPCANSFKWAFKGRPGSKDRGGDIPIAS